MRKGRPGRPDRFKNIREDRGDPGEVIVFCNQVYCFVKFSLTFASNLMGERTSAHVQNQN